MISPVIRIFPLCPVCWVTFLPGSADAQRCQPLRFIHGCQCVPKCGLATRHPLLGQQCSIILLFAVDAAAPSYVLRCRAHAVSPARPVGQMACSPCRPPAASPDGRGSGPIPLQRGLHHQRPRWGSATEPRSPPNFPMAVRTALTIKNEVISASCNHYSHRYPPASDRSARSAAARWPRRQPAAGKPRYSRPNAPARKPEWKTRSNAPRTGWDV